MGSFLARMLGADEQHVRLFCQPPVSRTDSLVVEVAVDDVDARGRGRGGREVGVVWAESAITAAFARNAA